MERVSDSVKNLIGRVCPTLPLGVAIKAEWLDIVGSEIAKFASFSSIKFGINGELCIIVEVLNSASIIFQYNSLEIKDRISKVTGYSLNKINLIIKQVSNMDIEHRDAA